MNEWLKLSGARNFPTVKSTKIVAEKKNNNIYHYDIKDFDLTLNILKGSINKTNKKTISSYKK